MNILVGPVLLDFPYVYKLDGDKLMCTKFIPELNQRCTGLIDYDLGFNNLVCNECGRKYNALDLEKKDSGIEIIKGGSVNMKVILKRGNKTIERNTGTDYIKKSPKKKNDTTNKNKKMQVLFKGQKRDTSQKLTQPCLSHDDMMKARKEIMNRQNNKKNKKEEDIKVEEKDTNTGEESKKEAKYVDDEMINAFKEQSASLDDGLLVDESNVENPGVSIHDDLTDINRIEDEYGHLEEEFGGETYEKIFKGDTKKFY